MGKGQFILEQASRNPDVNFVGIEKYSTVLLKAIRKREQMELSNIYFLCEDARELAEIFGPGEVERIYLNFSDPWPKDRHARRRLTSPPFMAVYDQILQKDGRVEFKTASPKPKRTSRKKKEAAAPEETVTEEVPAETTESADTAETISVAEEPAVEPNAVSYTHLTLPTTERV